MTRMGRQRSVVFEAGGPAQSRLALLCLLVGALCLGCRKHSDNAVEPVYPPCSGAYLGQTLPDTTPRRFAAGEFLARKECMWHGPLAFSPDGNELFFGRIILQSRIELVCSRQVDGVWSSPQVVPFAPGNNGNSPAFTADGNQLFYLNGGQGIQTVSRIDGGWSAPRAVSIATSLSLGWQISLAHNRSLYVELWSNNQYDIYRVPYVDGRYGAPELAGGGVNSSASEICPYIDPYENFILFSSARTGGYGHHDLYVCFKKKNGAWSDAINLGSTINSPAEDGAPALSPDGTYLFFTSWKSGDAGYNQYWVRAEIVNRLQSSVNLE